MGGGIPWIRPMAGWDALRRLSDWLAVSKTFSEPARLDTDYTDMMQHFPEERSTWLNLVGNTMPPRHPNTNEDDDEEEDDDNEKEEQREPAVIREPDEDD